MFVYSHFYDSWLTCRKIVAIKKCCLRSCFWTTQLAESQHVQKDEIVWTEVMENAKISKTNRFIVFHSQFSIRPLDAENMPGRDKII